MNDQVNQARILTYSFQNYYSAIEVLKEISVLKLKADGFTLKPLKISEEGGSAPVLFL